MPDAAPYTNINCNESAWPICLPLLLLTARHTKANSTQPIYEGASTSAERRIRRNCTAGCALRACVCASYHCIYCRYTKKISQMDAVLGNVQYNYDVQHYLAAPANPALQAPVNILLDSMRATFKVFRVCCQLAT